MRSSVGMRGTQRGSTLAIVALVLLAGSISQPAVAVSGRTQSGETGSYQLVDSADLPGSTCTYDPVTGALHSVQARAPIAYAVDRTPGVDQQRVSVRARLQRRTVPDAAWVTVESGSAEDAVATDSTSPFRATALLVPPPGAGDERVQWVVRWFGPTGHQTGLAITEVNWYAQRLAPGIPAGVAQQFCVASRAGAPAVVVRHGNRRLPNVALTFDFGGRIGDALSIVRWLAVNGVPATIFTTGTTGAGTAAGRRVLHVLATHPDLFALGNHSWSHPDFTKLTTAQIASQLHDTETAVAPLAGQTTKPWFRPPYGRANAKVLAAVGSAGWSTAVRWDVVTTDFIAPWHAGPTPAELTAVVLGHVRNGSIVIMHLGGYSTLKALPGIVAGLDDRGLTPVTLPSLLGL